MSESSRRDAEPLREGINRRHFDLWIVGEGRDIEELLAMYLESQGHRAYLVDGVISAVKDERRRRDLDGAVVNVTDEQDAAERAVRAIHETRPDLGIVVMVGQSATGFQRRLYAAGASLVVEKPCDPKLLVTKIERTAARSAGNLYPESSDDRPVDRSVGFEGSLSAMHVSDLLLVLSQNQATGWLQVRVGDARYRLAVEAGAVTGAMGPQSLTGRKAARRAIRQTRGTFSFSEVGELAVPSHLHDEFERTDNLILMAMQEADELPRLLESLPSVQRQLRTTLSSESEIAELFGDTGVSALAPLLEGADPLTVAELIERSPSPDLEVAKMLKRALDEEVVQAVSQSERTDNEESSRARERIDTPSGV
jgi:DNA-binding NarL/FixJ family response regulator